MPDDTTAHLGLPLPHPSHLLSEDVQRLRDALTGVDAAYQSQHQDVQQQLAATIGEVNTSLTTTTNQVNVSLDATTADMARQLRRVRIMNQLLGLNI